ncbi:M protein, serotype 5-like isoform X1 [Panicum miliaceum]|uniref:M protein, serotype 5-like isoform X1 n=1 Tax=Panicum miliaceum TaxID=4540 RepID=A0A3L6QY52_PANMI|nr:M protein, serotype 5-like isoform X1 [Panicum miliaceum]
MAPAGGSDKTGESGGWPMRHGVDRSAAAGGGGGGAAADQDLGTESGIGKMKAAVMSKNLINLDGNGEHKVAYDDYQRILKEIEGLKAELDEDVKELGYCVTFDVVMAFAGANSDKATLMPTDFPRFVAATKTEPRSTEKEMQEAGGLGGQRTETKWPIKQHHCSKLHRIHLTKNHLLMAFSSSAAAAGLAGGDGEMAGGVRLGSAMALVAAQWRSCACAAGKEAGRGSGS